MTLSLLCVTKGEPHAAEFLADTSVQAAALGAEFVVAHDGDFLAGADAEIAARLSAIPKLGANSMHYLVKSNGSIESVLDEAASVCSGDYILRIDDDELISAEMMLWLYSGEYTQSDVWSFPRKHLWRDGYLTNPPLYPDIQTRLTVKEKAGGRKQVHDGSPFGAGRVANVHILHHKFLVKSYVERKALAARYDSLREGAGTGHWLPFNLPEDAFETLEVAK
ncbi:MAG: glycosyltransferase family 2 protein [Anaerolineales bacterium]|nr:MAG: glycosyltransferase family 2 protein [Anaerolineales bacterium]